MCNIPDAEGVLRTLSIRVTGSKFYGYIDILSYSLAFIPIPYLSNTSDPLPSPVTGLQATSPTTTTLTITWTVSGSIERVEVTYNYTVNRCSAPQGAPRTDTISDGSMRSYTLRDLNEDSRYTITVRAFNTAGSTMATVTADTLASGEAGMITKFSHVHVLCIFST